MIFLSIGYSTCHWLVEIDFFSLLVPLCCRCHVMERESFESEEVAKIMNQHFVNIKVDREERPDIDKVYMTFVQVSGNAQYPFQSKS